MTKISIVSPCFNEELNVAACCERVRGIMEQELPGLDYEHIFVDNYSTDGTLDILRRLAADDYRVKVILNSRNYGPFRSTFNALRSATGDAVLVMLPVDMQDPPELIPQFVRLWQDGKKIVRGKRVSRAEGYVMRTVRRAYYRFLHRLADIDIPVDTAEFQLLDRQVLDALLQRSDHYPYIRGLIADIGFANETATVPYQWRERHDGFSKNRLINLIDQGLNGVISFTSAPLRVGALVGFVLAILSLAYGTIQLVLNLINDTAPAGIATLIVALFFFSGVQLFFIGLLGEYVAAIHQQVRRGAQVIERETINIEK
ncbi:MAG: glycosyltransferase family 2 protein [Rhodospirillales bacterium]|tara:strand:- start:3491 stop:4435 length:945 start_codon:yes stop_codon:yes gene_type:complete